MPDDWRGLRAGDAWFRRRLLARDEWGRETRAATRAAFYVRSHWMRMPPPLLARHPIYGGVILLAFGWALWVQGTLTLLWALVLTVFFDVKSRREELWLIARFPAYADYRRRVCKLLPFIY